jgi:hypothetical protein
MAAESNFAFRKVTTFFVGMAGGRGSSRGDLQWIQTCAAGTIKSPQVGQFMDFNSTDGPLELMI